VLHCISAPLVSECAGVLIKWNVCVLINNPNMCVYYTLSAEGLLRKRWTQECLRDMDTQKSRKRIKHELGWH